MTGTLKGAARQETTPLEAFVQANGFTSTMEEYGSLGTSYARWSLGRAAQLSGLAAAIQGPESVQAAARRLGLHEGAVLRFARACAFLGLCTLDPSESATWNIPSNLPARSDVRDRVLALLQSRKAQADPQSWVLARILEFFLEISRHAMAPENIAPTLKTGFTPWEIVPGFGMDRIFDLYEQEVRRMEIFQGGMFAGSIRDNFAIMEHLDWRGRSILDVGGGSATMALAYRNRFGTDGTFAVYDRAGSEPLCRKLEGLIPELCPAVDQYLSGDFFAPGSDEGLPLEDGGLLVGAADVVVLGRVLHDWCKDEDAARILRRCHGSLRQGGELCILERVLPDDRLGPVALYDFAMLATANGLERTLGEYRDLCEAAGFTNVKLLKTETLKNVILARRS